MTSVIDTDVHVKHRIQMIHSWTHEVGDAEGKVTLRDLLKDQIKQVVSSI